MNQAQPSASLLALLDSLFRGASFNFVGNVSSASPNVVVTTSPAGVAAGASISGSAITPGTTIISVNSSTDTLIMSVNGATNDSTAALVVTNPGPAALDLELGLFTGNPVLSVNTVLSDLTEPTYTGYARVDLTILPFSIDPNGNVVDDYPSAHFQPTGMTGLPVDVTGYFVVYTPSGGSPTLLFSEYFPTSQQLLTTTSDFDVIFRNIFANALSWGGSQYVG